MPSPACPIVAAEPRPLFDFDFTTLSLGDHSAASLATSTGTAAGNQAGLTFARTTPGFVQTAGGTIVTSAVDGARIGNRTTTLSKRGLVIQPRGHNILVGAPDYRSWGAGSSWSAGSGFTAPSSTTGPDGTNNADTIDVASGGFSPYSGFFTLAHDHCFSVWLGQANGGSARFIDWGNYPTVGQVQSTADVTTGGWERFILAGNPTALGFSTGATMAVADGRNLTGFGGAAQAARSYSADFAQLEKGQYASEPHFSGAGGSGGFWDCDVLTYPTGSHLIAANGQVKLYAKFTPKFGSTHAVWWDPDGSGYTQMLQWFLLSWSAAPNQVQAYVLQSDNKLRVKAAGTTVTSTNAFPAWSKNDTLEIYLVFGNSVASIAKVRVNGGAWVDLALPTVTASLSPGSDDVGIFMNTARTVAPALNANDHGQPPIWLHRLTFYDRGEPV